MVKDRSVLVVVLSSWTQAKNRSAILANSLASYSYTTQAAILQTPGLLINPSKGGWHSHFRCQSSNYTRNATYKLYLRCI